MDREIYKDLDNIYESIESLNNKIRKQKRELELAYKGIEQLNNTIHHAIEYIENSIKYYNGERLESTQYNYFHIDTIDTLLRILKGEE